MPTITTPDWSIDYVEAGQGPTVLLLHSSVSGNRQWRALMTALSDRYHVIAPNLIGYGQTSPCEPHRVFRRPFGLCHAAKAGAWA